MMTMIESKCSHGKATDMVVERALPDNIETIDEIPEIPITQEIQGRQTTQLTLATWGEKATKLSRRSIHIIPANTP